MHYLRPMRYALLCLSALAPLASSAAFVIDTEPNDSLSAAQALDGKFTVEFSPDIGNTAGVNTSEFVPHVSILGSGDDTLDYYGFTVLRSGSIGIFDLDYGTSELDAALAIWDDEGTLLFENDDYAPYELAGAGGSDDEFDPFIEFTFARAGSYVVGVAAFPSQAVSGGWRQLPEFACDDSGCIQLAFASEPLPAGSAYVLQVSRSDVPMSPVPLPATWLLWVSGIALVGRRVMRGAGHAQR